MVLCLFFGAVEDLIELAGEIGLRVGLFRIARSFTLRIFAN